MSAIIESPFDGSHMHGRGTRGEPASGAGRGARPTQTDAEEGTRNGRDRAISREGGKRGGSGDRGDVSNVW